MDGARDDQMGEINAMRVTMKNALLRKNLKEHPAFQKLVAYLRKRDQSYTTLLINKPMDEKRVEWFSRREEDRFILGFFEVDKTLESLEKQLDYQLSEDVLDDGQAEG